MFTGHFAPCLRSLYETYSAVHFYRSFVSALIWQCGYYGDQGYLSCRTKSINVRLNNGDSTPSLIQAWLDTGDPSSPPDSVRVPFIITPPVFRMEPLSGQTMRIMYTGEKLPADRESLFWLNVLDIPAKPSLPENLKKHRDIITFSLPYEAGLSFFPP